MVAYIQTDLRHGVISIEAPSRLWLPRTAAPLPTARVRHTLPPDLADPRLNAVVELEVIGRRGRRRFVPAENVGVFLQMAYAVGFTLLSRDLQFDARSDAIYRLMKFMHSVADCGDRPIHRRLNSSDDLVIRDSKARRGKDRSLLPDHLGLNADGSGRRWSPERLIEEGRLRAETDGYVAGNIETAIHYGLLAAAERNPIRPALDEFGSGKIVRFALFDDTKLPAKATPEVIENIGRRWTATLYERAKGDWPTMSKGLFGAKNNLATCLSRRKKPGDPMTTDEARAGLAEWGWRSQLYFADCVDAWARHFLQVFPDRLTAEETSAFKFMYCAHPNFGGLAPIMFHQRLSLLKPIYSQLERDPYNPQLIGTAQRVLSYYGDIVADIRATDRIKKQDQGGDPIKQEAALKELKERTIRRDYGDVGVGNLIEQWARDVLATRGIGCPHGQCDLEVDVSPPDDPQRPIDVTCRCTRHGWSEQTHVTLVEMRAAADEY